MKTFMPDETPEERLRLLRDNCDSSEIQTYYKDLNDEDLDQKREELTANFIEISQHDDELDEAKAIYKAKAQPLKDANKELLNEVKTRKSMLKGMVYNIANHDDGMMETFNEQGQMIGSRRLKPEEKQQKLFPLKKAADA
jgi:uncharacterized coiled-coil DUF342 family protein